MLLVRVAFCFLLSFAAISLQLSVACAQVVPVRKSVVEPAAGAIVFLHGLLGSSQETFTFRSGTSGAKPVFWLDEINKDTDRLGIPRAEPLANYNLYSLDYDAGVTNCRNVAEINTLLNQQILDILQRYEHVVLVGHSLGGY
jgi:pimeloyl-ACP methyl ester carboxylesterase